MLFCEFFAETGQPYLAPVEDSWMFGQPLLGYYAPELLENSLEILLREYDGLFPAVVFSGVRRTHPETLKLYALFSRYFRFYRHKVVTQGSASLVGGVDGWLSRRSANFRAKLKKAARKAKERGVEFERVRPRGAAEGARVYERALAVEARSWKGIGRCGMTESPSREFYANLMARLANRGSAYVIFAREGGEDIGFIFGSGAGGVYRGQQFSFVAKVADLSLGNLLQWRKINWLCELGFRRYDMGPVTGPRMEYKFRWVEQTREIETWVMRAI